jgi:hypothetical protein
MALEIPTTLGRASGISGRKTSRTLRKCIQKKHGGGVAFGAAGSFVCRRRERLQLTRLDRSAFARPSAQQASTPWARRVQQPGRGWCFRCFHAYGSHGRIWFGPGSPSTGSLPGAWRSLMLLPSEAQCGMRYPFRRSQTVNRKPLTANLVPCPINNMAFVAIKMGRRQDVRRAHI